MPAPQRFVFLAAILSVCASMAMPVRAVSTVLHLMPGGSAPESTLASGAAVLDYDRAAGVNVAPVMTAGRVVVISDVTEYRGMAK